MSPFPLNKPASEWCKENIGDNEMSLDIYFYAKKEIAVFDANITHNLGKMAAKAGVYEVLWDPASINIKCAGEMIERLENAIELLSGCPTYFDKFDAPNGWGKRQHLINFMKEVLEAARKEPEATVRVSR